MIEVIPQWKIRASMLSSQLIYLENNALIANDSNHAKVGLSESMTFYRCSFQHSRIRYRIEEKVHFRQLYNAGGEYKSGKIMNHQNQ